MPKTTPLHGWHLSRNAKMADFAGYQMPLWYSSVKNEHLSVLTAAGLFDTSHMAAVLVGGPDARKLLQRCFTKDLDACIGPDRRPLPEGRSVYGAFLNEDGGVIDDAIVFELRSDRYMVVVNAAMGGPVSAHLEAHANGASARIDDLTDKVGKIDIQGPASGIVLRRILSGADDVFTGMVYFSFKGGFGPYIILISGAF